MGTLKKSGLLLTIGIMAIPLAGCQTSKTYRWNVSTGDTVDVKMDTSDRYTLKQADDFDIIKDGEVVSQGKFISSEGYFTYSAIIENDEDAKVLKTGEKDGNEYIFYKYEDNAEYDYIVLIGDSDTAVILGNVTSKESAEDAFDRLELSIAEDE